MNRARSNNEARRPRQTPVSCQLCRAKKLRCDRQHPCSNCSARGVTCQPQLPIRHVAESPQACRQEVSGADNSEIFARLEKLENTVYGTRQPSPLPLSSQQRYSPSATPGANNVDEEHMTASKWLEGNGTRGHSVFPGCLHHISLSVHPIRQSLTDPSVIHDDRVRIQLPTKIEATNLFKCYMDNVHALHPVIDVQSIQHMIDAIYIDPHASVYSEFSHIALLLSIFASASHFWRSQGERDSIFTSTKDATVMSSLWSKDTLDILEYSRRATSGSIEDIQATIIISYLIYNTQGLSTMLRSLNSIMIMMARDLSLHKTDNPRKVNPEANGLEKDDIKRRIWWHITATDWLLAFSPGPQEGTYSIQPQHMCVKLPSHDHLDGSDRTPSSISYLLQRIRLAEICRNIVDTLPPFLDIEMMNYDHIIALDGQVESVIRNLPPFFRLDQSSHVEHLPQVNTHRYLVHLGIHIRRSKLHQPFLVRGFMEPKYAYSRNACLDSARTVLEVCSLLEEKKSSLTCIPARLGTVVQHVFMASIILVTDLCFSKDEGHEEQRQAEVMQACRILDGLKDESTMARKFLDPLMEILQKHRIRLLNQTSASPISGLASGNKAQHTLATSLVGEEDFGEASPTAAHQPFEATQGSDGWAFDEMMQNYIDLGVNAEAPVWDSLFADFDSYRALGAGGNEFF